MSRKKTGRIVGAAVLGLMTPLVLAAPARAETPIADGGQIATYGATTLRLAQSWGTAKSCVVFSESRTDCFASGAEANAAIAREGLTAAATADTAQPNDTSGSAGGERMLFDSCPKDWVCLYNYKNFNVGHEDEGRELKFQAHKWQDLENWGFRNRTSSWKNCRGDAHSLKDVGANPDKKFKMPANSSGKEMGAFDNKADKVHA